MSMLLFEDNKFIGGKYSFNSPFTSLPPALSGFTFTRASNATVLQNGQLITLASNQFGTSYDPVTGMYGYLSETAATNLVLYSEDLSNAAWAKGGCTIGAPTTLAGITAYPIIEDTSLAVHRAISTGMAFTSGQAYAFRCLVKANGRDFVNFRVNNSGGDLVNVVVQISTATVVTTASGSATAESLGNGVVLIKAYGTSTVTANTTVYIRTLDDATINNHTGDGVSGVYATAIQVETGPYASSYIPTTSATATRAATVLSAPYSSIQGNNLTAYTLYADYRDTNNSGFRYVANLSDGSSNNGAYIINDTTKALLAIGGGVIQSNQTSANTTTRTKAALSLQNNSAKGAFNGVGVVEDTVVTMPAALTAVHLGVNWNSINQLNGYLFEARYYPTALTQAQINGLTL